MNPIKIIISTGLLFLAGTLAADPVPHATYSNPRTGDSWDSDTSLLMKLLDIMATSQTGAPYVAFTSAIATADGTANLPARATRRRIGWINTSGETVYISNTSGKTGTLGLTVPAGGTGGMNYTGALYVHSASGAARVDFAETYD